MRKRIGEKLVTLMLVGCLVVGSLAGCGKKDDDKATSSDAKGTSQDSASGDNKEADAWELASTTPYEPYPETVTYTTGLQVNATITYPDGSTDTSEDNAFTRLYKDKLNIQNKTAFEAVGQEDSEQKVNMAITTGELPDIMRVTDYATLKELVENDLIEDLTDSYNNCASDLMKEIYASNDNKALDMATFDGKLYAIPTTSISSGPEMLWLRGDWMDKLGLKNPETLADIENILTQFVQQDPGGNGAGKTIGLALTMEGKGFCGSYAGAYQSNNIFTNFGAFPKQWVAGKDGKAVYGSVQPEMKQALTVLADWYKKGLIDPQVAVRTKNDDITSIVTNGQCGAFFCGWWAPYLLKDSYAMNPDLEWRAFVVPAGPDGKVTMFTGNPNQNYTVVRKGFEHPELLIKAKNVCLDYNQGTKSYTDTSDIAKEYLDYVNHAYGVDPMGGFDYYNAAALAYEHISEAIDGKRDPKDMIQYENTLYTSCKNYLDAVKNKTQPDPTDWLNYNARMVSSKLMYDTEVNEVNPVFFDQTESMQLKWASLEKMEQEALLKILMNEESVDYFDKFVSDWNAAGGEQITKEVNEAIGK
ncbi:MAG TPA: ABC transporter substrate-binding protein [Lachnospiraceae bacterium]|nr:ABC transporter substrate-binding protein [Lachnospiraceae bacterium]